MIFEGIVGPRVQHRGFVIVRNLERVVPPNSEFVIILIPVVQSVISASIRECDLIRDCMGGCIVVIGVQYQVEDCHSDKEASWVINHNHVVCQIEADIGVSKRRPVSVLKFRWSVYNAEAPWKYISRQSMSRWYRISELMLQIFSAILINLNRFVSTVVRRKDYYHIESNVLICLRNDLQEVYWTWGRTLPLIE